MPPAASPLKSMQEQSGAGFLTFGPADAGVEIVDTFGFYELEYAAIRKGAALLDQPQRGLIELRGGDRLDFLHRFVTNDVKKLADHQCTRAFLLNRTGRIQADLLILALPDRLLINLDQLQASAVADELNQLLFSEDVTITDLSSQQHQLSLFGPTAAALLQSLVDAQAASPSSRPLTQLDPLQATHVTLADQQVVVYRLDQTGSPCLHLLLPTTALEPVYIALTTAMGGIAPEPQAAVDRPSDKPWVGRSRAVGWMAFNTARIEAGSPLFQVDFGSDSLPHETGLIEPTVSFTKGCYVGQEIVARMHNLGHPRRVLAGLRLTDDRMPISGTAVYDANQPDRVVGGVTSSTLSPMLGGVAIGFAMLKWGSHTPGTQVVVPAEGARVPATVQALRFI